MSDNDRNRRDFLKKSAIVALGGIAGGITMSQQVLAGTKVQPLNTAKGVKPNKNTVVMPDGSLRTRGELLRQLGFDPSTPPDAWLTICGDGCGVNSSALNNTDRERLMKRGFKFQGKELVEMPGK